MTGIDVFMIIMIAKKGKKLIKDVMKTGVPQGSASGPTSHLNLSPALSFLLS